jgi:hypothetical protein
MLATPAAMATPPSTASPTSWNPAVPPPPVTGAGGYEVYEGVGVGGGLVVSVGLGVGLPLGEVVLLAVLLGVGDGLSEPLALGGNRVIEPEGVGSPPVPLEVQAESATQVSTAMRPQPTAVDLSRCAIHAMAVRPLIEPSSCSRQRPFPDGHPQKPAPEGIRAAGLCADRVRATNSSGENTQRLYRKPRLRRNLQWRAQQRNITLVG